MALLSSSSLASSAALALRRSTSRRVITRKTSSTPSPVDADTSWQLSQPRSWPQKPILLLFEFGDPSGFACSPRLAVSKCDATLLWCCCRGVGSGVFDCVFVECVLLLVVEYKFSAAYAT